ncbi:hypothetical protein ASD72_05820 [Pseudoxanthomonas sp. Root630]|nr:hypothetical protein ASD72_05820 [Pseudoxanthomonas sp. Root630]
MPRLRACSRSHDVPPYCPTAHTELVATHCVSDCVEGAGQFTHVLTWLRVAPVFAQADHAP